MMTDMTATFPIVRRTPHPPKLHPLMSLGVDVNQCTADHLPFLCRHPSLDVASKRR